MLTINTKFLQQAVFVVGLATFFFILWVPAYAGSLTFVLIVSMLLFSYWSSVVWLSSWLYSLAVK